jgi:undecaprenyl-diphosphatase
LPALLAIFFLLAFSVNIHNPQGPFFDQPVLTWLHAQQTSLTTSLAKLFTFTGSLTVLGTACVLIFIWLWLLWRRSAIFFAISMIGAVVLMELVKHLIARPRPEIFPHLILEHGFSFPSGHAVGSTALIVTLYLIAQQASPRARWLFALFGGLWALCVSVSRLYLQVHYPSDILASWALSTFWVLLVNLWYARRRPLG